jgi:hypothetical protein
MAEPVFYNAAVTGQRGAPLGGPFWRQNAQGGVQRVSDLRRLLRPPAPGHLGLDVPQPAPDPPPRGTVEALLQALPPAWQALVLQPEAPIPDWSAWERHPSFFLRRLDPVSPGTAMMLQVYRMQRRGVGTTGQVEATGELVVLADMGGAILGPAVVDVWDDLRSGRTLDPASRTFVFSAGHPWPLGPRPWMVGNTPVLTLSASVAAQRWKARLWENSRVTRPACPSGRPFGRMTWTLLPRRSQDFGQVGGLPTAGPAPTRKRRRDEADAATPASQSPRHPSIPRPSVVERIASREPLEGGRPGLPRARLTGCTAVLAPVGDGRPRSPWHHVWGAVAHSGLSFVVRACAWRVLHGCVVTGAFKRYVSMPVSPADRFCTHSTCGGPHYDTLSHVFLACPLASRVWSWLGTLLESVLVIASPCRWRCSSPMTAGQGARRQMPRPSGFGSASSAWRRFGRRTAAATTATERPCHCDCGPGLSGSGAHGQRRRPCHSRRAPRRHRWGGHRFDAATRPHSGGLSVPLGPS